ncbi:putative serine/threonine-protein kinase [Nymphaea thermarum]|nr:putative serine/threonine-protein kinase [Nymphaea thermarum]
MNAASPLSHHPQPESQPLEQRCFHFKVKCYVHQLLSGLEHCHNRGVLHRDIKGSNLLLDNGGVLKIADFGLACFYNPDHLQPMTSRVVTLWYRPPELLLGATYYSVEQLHKIFKLCGSPSEEYWKKSKLPHATIFKPQQPYKRCISGTFKSFPPSSLPLVETLLAIEPNERGTASAALKSEFFTTKPCACEPSSLPKYPPSKEMDAKLRDEAARRQRGLSGRGNGGDAVKKARPRERSSRAVPAPEANAELQANLDRRRLINQANAKSKSEKFPPPHQDGSLGFPMDPLNQEQSFEASDASFTSTTFSFAKAPAVSWSGPIANPVTTGPAHRSSAFISKLTSAGFPMGLRKDKVDGARTKGKERVSEVFGGSGNA